MRDGRSYTGGVPGNRVPMLEDVARRTMEKLKVTVVDMQPITPAVGGGRQRLLGLYHAMGPGIDATYVGTYDWPGESHRDVQLTDGLREICVPLEPAHFEAASRLSDELGGATVIDAAFPEQVHHSPAFLAAAREHIGSADVVIFTHPWCYPPLAGDLRPDQLVIYDAQNVETMLKAEAFQRTAGSEALLRVVASSEQEVIERSDLVLACSREDADIFVRLFDMDPMKLRIVPNGAFTDRFGHALSVDRIRNRAEMGLRPDRPIAMFMGSMYGPNVEAARYINDELAQALPGMDFLIVGGVGDALVDRPSRSNVITTGMVEDERRDALLLASDVAINPMSAGSGTNVKMFDYMAAGLPVLSTAIGARGIGTKEASPDGVFVAELSEFPSKLPELLARVGNEPGLRGMVLREVRQRFSWERVSHELGILVTAAAARHRASVPSRVAMLTTWNTACGIGEHSAYLAEAMTSDGADVLILANDMNGHHSLGFERDLHRAVSRAWTWDNKHWVDSRVDVETIERALRLSRPNLLLFQHHTGFLPQGDVERLVAVATRANVPVVVEFHDARNVPAQHKHRLIDLGATLVVHHADELDGVGDAEGRIRVIPLPVRMGALGRRLRDASSDDGGPVITGFGFLRPYKGVLTAIRMLPLLRKEFPLIRYVGWHASYGGVESERHLAECLEEARRLGVEGMVEIDTGFHPVEDVVAEMAHADVIVMPYAASSEGASAAVNAALAAARPIVVSPSAIFRPVERAVHVVAKDEVSAYAQAVGGLLRDRDRAEAMAAKAAEWAERHSYNHAAREILGLA